MKVRLLPTTLAALFSLASATCLTGCGGGGAASLSPAAKAVQIYEPNYISALGSGRKWSRQLLRCRVVSPEGRALDPVFTRALGAWTPFSEGLFTFITAASGAADITLETVPAGSLGGKTIGLTTISYRTSDSRILRAQIKVDASLDDDAMVQVMAHELGHALGLDGHSPDRADLMYAHAHLPLVTTERDRNTLFTINADTLAGLSRAQKSDGGTGEPTTTIVCQFPKN